MRSCKFLIALLFLVSPLMADTPDASVEQEQNTTVVSPSWAFKLRVVPAITSTLGSGILAERLNHNIWIDTEYFATPQFSVGLLLGHGRYSVNASEKIAGRIAEEFIKEFRIGAVASYYFNPDLGKGTFFVRAEATSLFPDTEAGGQTNKHTSINKAEKSFGFRTGLSAGYAVITNSLTLDFGLGLNTQWVNPYGRIIGESDAGVPEGVRNVVMGLSSVYPTLNVSLGIAL